MRRSSGVAGATTGCCTNPFYLFATLAAFAAPTPLTQPVLKGCHPWPPSSETPLLAMIQLPCQPMRVLTSAAT